MSFFEKMAMILVPAMGLTAILYFFTWYLPDIEKSNIRESQRLQGQQSLSAVNIKLSDKIHKPKAIQRTSPNKNFLKWESDESVTYMPRSLKNHTYTKQTPSYTYTANENNRRDEIQLKYKRQEQENARRLKKHQKIIKDKECSYYLERKQEVRDRMKRGYKASQYNRLEKRRKHWSKQYADNCFSGYQYPR